MLDFGPERLKQSRANIGLKGPYIKIAASMAVVLDFKVKLYTPYVDKVQMAQMFENADGLIARGIKAMERAGWKIATFGGNPEGSLDMREMGLYYYITKFHSHSELEDATRDEVIDRLMDDLAEAFNAADVEA